MIIIIIKFWVCQIKVRRRHRFVRCVSSAFKRSVVLPVRARKELIGAHRLKGALLKVFVYIVEFL